MSAPTRDEIIAAFATIGTAVAAALDAARPNTEGPEAGGEVWDDTEATVRRTTLSRATVLELAAAGKIPSAKVGRRRLFPRHAVDAALAALSEKAAG